MTVLFLFLVVFCLCSVVQSLNTNIVEYNALWEIYNSTNGPYWTYDQSVQEGVPWIFGYPNAHNPCNTYPFWYGLLCAMFEDFNNVGHVMILNMTGIGNMTGTLPPVIANFSQLLFIVVTDKPGLVGDVPALIDMPRLYMANFSSNGLTGTIPDTWSNLTSLQYLSLASNQLKGTIPHSFYHLSEIQFLSVFNNSMTGTISHNVGDLKKLISLNLGENHFRGDIPACLGYIPYLEQLLVENNDFDGVLPEVFPSSLRVLQAGNNQLVGTLPASLCLAKNLSTVAINNNRLEGTLPPCLGDLPKLYVFQAQWNRFTGHVDIFNGSLQTQLMIVDITDNGFSGTFPGSFFLLPSLQSIAASKNCFHGALPDQEMCEGASRHSLRVISLDGMQSGSRCTFAPWDPTGLTVGYITNLMEGIIPDCIWSFPNISHIHFAGNGFRGSLPAHLSALPAKLDSVVLTHNELTGTIPPTFLRHNFQNLDLSFNNLVGEINGLSAMYFTDDKAQADYGTAITLQNNRLSGHVPSVLRKAYNVDVLDGNHFQCQVDRRDLPEHDPQYSDYFCGSTVLDNASIFFTILVSVVAIAAAGVYLSGQFSGRRGVRRSGKQQQQPPATTEETVLHQLYRTCHFCYQYCLRVQTWVEETPEEIIDHPLPSSDDPHPSLYSEERAEREVEMRAHGNFYRYLAALTLVRRLGVGIAAVSVFVCLPVYLGFYSYQDRHTGNHPYSMTSQRYGWITTSVFLTGEPPAVMLMIIWTLLLWLILYLTIAHYNVHFRHQPENRARYPPKPSFFYRMRRSVVTAAHKTRESLLFTRESFLQEALLVPKYVATGTAEPVDDESDLRHVQDAWQLTPEEAASLRQHVHHSGPHAQPQQLAQSVLHKTVLTGEEVQASSSSRNTLTDSRLAERASIPDSVSTVDVGDTSAASGKEAVSAQTATTGGRSSAGSGDEHNRHSPSSSLRDSAHSAFTSETVKDDEELTWYEFCSVSRYVLLGLVVYFLNFGVSLSVNAAYLLLQTTTRLGPGSKVAVQLGLASFKILWNMLPVRWLMVYFPYSKETAKLHVLILLTNTVLAPCLAVIAADNSCFHDLFFGTDQICSAYVLPVCVETYQQYNYDTQTYSTACAQYENVEYVTEFSPSFIYYYTCGSQLMTFYLPVFIYTYALLAVGFPLAFSILALVPRDAKIIPESLFPLIDGVVRPQDRGQQSSSAVQSHQKLLRPSATQAMLTQHLVVLLTFGINAPVLAVVMAIAIAVDAFTWQVLLLRYVHYGSRNTPFGSSAADSAETGDVQQRLQELHEAIGLSWRGLRNTMWFVFYWALIFNAALVFDTAGDGTNWRHALWVVWAAIGILVFTRMSFVGGVAYGVTLWRRWRKNYDRNHYSWWCWSWGERTDTAEEHNNSSRNSEFTLSTSSGRHHPATNNKQTGAWSWRKLLPTFASSSGAQHQSEPAVQNRLRTDTDSLDRLLS